MKKSEEQKFLGRNRLKPTVIFLTEILICKLIFYQSLDFMDTADSDRLKLLEKLSGREELEDTTDKLFDNEIRDDNQYDVEILNIISAVKDEHQELESLAAIDAFKKT